MSRYGEIYNLIVELYKVKKYKEVVDKVDKYINMDLQTEEAFII